MSWNIQKPGDYINGPLTVTGTLTVSGSGPHSIAGQLASTGGTAGFQMQPRDGSGANWLLYNPTGDDFRVYNNIGNDVVIVNNFGNFGLGITPSAWQTTSYKVFQIGSTAAFYCDSNAYSVLSNNSFINAAYSERYLINSFATKQTTFQGTHSFWTAPTGVAGDPISFTERVRVENLGDLNLLTGNVKVSSGKGIDFSAGSNAVGMTSEILNDYEEGTFTPAITGSTTAGTATYVGRSGRYTKVGNQVHVQIFMDWSGHTGTGDIRITGLPFTNGANFSGAVVGYANAITVSANSFIAAYVDAAQPWILLNQIPTGGGTNQTVPIDPAGTLVVSATYSI